MDFGLNLSIIQWNIQGFINNKFGLEYLTSTHNPDIILLQETHIINKNQQLLHLPNYQIFHHNKHLTYAKSGIAILVKNTINASNHKTSTNQLLHQTITIHGLKDLHITNIYKETDINLTQQLLQDLPQINSGHHIVAGDLNAQNTLWGSQYNSRSGNMWESFAHARNLVFLNNGAPTLLNTRNTLTSVDVSMASSDLAGCLSWSCPSRPIAGDHFPIFIQNGSTKIEKKFIGRFKENKANWELFRNKTELFDNQFLKSNNVNQEAALLKKIIRKSANESMPTSRCPKQKTSPVWFNAEISTLIREKKKAWKKVRERETPTKILNFKRLCAQVRKACKKAKQETWKCFVNSLSPTIDAKTLWNKVRKIKSNTISSFPPLFTESTVISHPEQKANLLARAWSSVGANAKFDRSLIQQKLNMNIDSLECSGSNLNLIIDTVTLSELHLALQNAKGTSPGKDKITYTMIKNSSSVLKTRLCQLYSNILKTGIYPHDWKQAVLAPIPKTGKNQNSTEGYRPISLLPVLSKIFDKIVTRRLWEACDEKILKIQHAYMANHGAHTLCHLLETKIKNNLNHQKHCIIVSEDLEKAFDRVVSTVVIKELHDWGIPKVFLKLASSFLSHRRISVKVDGYLSQNYILDNGIPQGSPFSVFLFNAYTNTLSKTLKEINGIDFIGIYADNIFALSSGTQENVSQSLNAIDKRIYEWSKKTGAVIPADKTEALHLCRKRNCNVSSITLRNKSIELKTKMRILGITFTRNLLWNEHIKTITIKLSKIQNLLKVICSRKKGPHIETALDICRSLTEGVTQHCISLYGYTSENNKNKINTAFNHCFRTAAGLLMATPTEAVRVEARYNDFQWLLRSRSAKLAAKSITTVSHPLHNDFWKRITSRNPVSQSYRSTCSIAAISKYLLDTHTPIPPKPPDIFRTNKNISIDISLNSFHKNNTSREAYNKIFLTYKANCKADIFYYTDGSLLEESPSYAVVEQRKDGTFQTIHQALLPPNAGIFNAELAAINFAVHHASKNNKRTVIFSDSLSVLKSLINRNSEAHRYVMGRTNRQNEIKLIWIPGHMGILGNELADKSAKQTFNIPLIAETPCLTTVMTNFHRAYLRTLRDTLWESSTCFLRTHNLKCERPNYHKDLSREKCITIARTRVGVTKFISERYYSRVTPRECV